MCEWIEGELIISHLQNDQSAQTLVSQIMEDRVPGFRVIETLARKLENLYLPFRQSKLNENREFYRLEVPANQEVWAISYIHNLYRGYAANFVNANVRIGNTLPPGNILTVGPNHVLSIAQPINWSSWSQSANPPLVSHTNFSLSQDHREYLRLIKAGQAISSNAQSVKMAVIDTGIANDAPFKITRQCTFVTGQQDSNNAVDDNGHGTAIATVIDAVYPGKVEFYNFKVADASGNATEWDTLAALVAAYDDTTIVNLSAEFGLSYIKCRKCGRQSVSSRSDVFEFVAGPPVKSNSAVPIIVAAGGNKQEPDLAFPARFANVVAVVAVASDYGLASYSNTGRKIVSNAPVFHENYYAMPGGDLKKTIPEYVGKYGTSAKQYAGTSFAAAYASGIIARLIGTDPTTFDTRDNILRALRTTADNTFTGYDDDKHGNGFLRL